MTSKSNYGTVEEMDSQQKVDKPGMSWYDHVMQKGEVRLHPYFALGNFQDSSHANPVSWGRLCYVTQT